jgi:hypothetical protein
MEGVVSFTPQALCVAAERREPKYLVGRGLGVLWCGSLKPGTHMRNGGTQFTCYEVQVRSTEESGHPGELESSVGYCCLDRSCRERHDRE